MRLPPERYPDGFAEHFQPLLDARERLLAKLDRAQKLCCRAAIDGLGEGSAPTVAQIVDASGLEPAAVTQALDALDRRDMLKLDELRQRVLALYPFSALPGRHQVEVRGKRLDAM